MELIIKTEQLKGLVSNSMKGVAKIKALPICEMMAIEQKKGVLTLTTSNEGGDILEVHDKVEGKDFSVVINAELFSKLVDKTTSEKVTLKLTDAGLEYKGNGKYLIPIPADDNGPVVFPFSIDAKLVAPKGKKEVEFNPGKKVAKKFETEQLKNIFKLHEGAVGTNMQQPSFTGFFFTKGKTVATDGRRIVITDMAVFDENTLLTYSFFSLVNVAGGKNITLKEDDKYVLLEGENFRAFGKKMDQELVDKFPVAAMTKLAETPYEGKGQISKSELLSVLDRINLFMDVEDRQSVRLNFTKAGLIMSNFKSTCNEEINVKNEGKKAGPEFSCTLNAEFFKSLVNAYPLDVITMSYGDPKTVKMEFNKTIQILATADEVK